MPAAAAPTRSSYTGFTSQPMAMAAVYRPGGISLSKAAAERMSLNIDLEGLHYSNGQIVLAGSPNANSGIDAALFLTALRMACESSDPSFSLDADNAEAWSEQGQLAARAVWEVAQRDYTWNPNIPANRGHNATIPDGLTLQTLSVRRDFPALWAKMAASYPDLKTRLVFRPSWLRETRVGEILYKADVLLKELASGNSIVNPSSKLRAAGIVGYVPPNLRSVVEAPFDATRAPGIRNSRLWFDLIPQSASNADPAPDTLPVLDRSRNPALYSTLERQGYFSSRLPAALEKPALFTTGDTTDLSKIYPKMFVRRHDPLSNKDITGTDAYLNLLASDVNVRTERYVAAYKELKELTEVFRAYVANVAIVRQDRTACDPVRQMPLYDAEKTATPLPQYHPSEMFISVLRYVTQQGRKRSLWLNSGNVVSGGIALRAKEFYDVTSIGMETQVMADLKRELALPAPAVEKAVWTGSSGRQFILLNLHDADQTARIEALLNTRQAVSPGTGASIKQTFNRTFKGESYKSFAGGSYDQCEHLCLNEAACVALDFEKLHKRCELFDTVVEDSPDNSTDIGVKGEAAAR